MNMDEWEKKSIEMLTSVQTKMQAELDKDDWNLKCQKMIEYMDESFGERIIPNIQEGDIRCLKRVPLTKYWENPQQISKPASEKAIQDFLSIKDDSPYAIEGKAWIILGILFVFFLLLL